MKYYDYSLDTSHELMAVPFNQGVKLIRSSSRCPNETHSVGSILQYPFNVYFINQQTGIQNLNTPSLATLQMNSIKEAIGCTVFDIFSTEVASQMVEVNKQVIEKSQTVVIDEIIFYKEEMHSFLTIKMPWYNAENAIVGLMGCSVLLGEQPLAESLKCIFELGLLANFKSELNHSLLFPGLELNNYYLSKRDREILYYLVRGKSARQIGLLLYLSPRTIEKHIETLKYKLRVHSKAELIEKIMKEYQWNH